MVQNCCGNRDSEYNPALFITARSSAGLERRSTKPEVARSNRAGRANLQVSLSRIFLRFVRTRCDLSLDRCYRTLLYRYKKARK